MSRPESYNVMLNWSLNEHLKFVLILQFFFRQSDKIPLLITEKIYFHICQDTKHQDIATLLGRGWVDLSTGKKVYATQPISNRRRIILWNKHVLQITWNVGGQR